MLMRLRYVAAFVLLLPCSSAFGQGVADLIKAAPVPEVIEIKDLPADYRAVNLKMAGGDSYGSLMQMIYMPMSMGVDSTRGPDGFALTEMLQVCWTSGQTIKSDTGEFLVAYRLGLEPIASQPDGKPNPKLRLTLLRKDAIVEISPRPDLTKERLAELFNPELQKTRATPASKANALSNLKQITLGMIMYQTDNDDLTPYVQDTKSAFAVTMPYIKNTDLFKSLNPAGSRILLNMAIAGVSDAEIEAPADTILYYDPKPWPDGRRLVGFTDGHVKFVEEQEWPRYEKSLHLKLKHYGKPLPAAYWKKIAPGASLGDG
jgi:hypothetical protein